MFPIHSPTSSYLDIFSGSLSEFKAAMESALLSSVSSVGSIPAVARLHCGVSIPRMSRLRVSRCGELSRSGLSSMARRAAFLEVQWKKLQFTARSAAGGGGFGGVDGGAGGGGGGGGGDGAAEGGESKPAAVASGVLDDPALSSDVIVLDVGVSVVSILYCCYSLRELN